MGSSNELMRDLFGYRIAPAVESSLKSRSNAVGGVSYREQAVYADDVLDLRRGDVWDVVEVMIDSLVGRNGRWSGMGGEVDKKSCELWLWLCLLFGRSVTSAEIFRSVPSHPAAQEKLAFTCQPSPAGQVTARGPRLRARPKLY